LLEGKKAKDFGVSIMLCDLSPLIPRVGYPASNCFVRRNVTLHDLSTNISLAWYIFLLESDIHKNWCSRIVTFHTTCTTTYAYTLCTTCS